MIKSCLFCLKDFEDRSRSSNRLYCDRSCAKKGRNKLKIEGKHLKSEKTCLGCGIFFVEKIANSGKTFCTRKCLHQYKYLQRTQKTISDLRPKYTENYYRDLVTSLGLSFYGWERENYSSGGKENRKRTRISVQCTKGHAWKVILSTLRKTNGGCQKCYSLEKRTSLEEIRPIVKERDFQLVEKTFSAGNKKAMFICNKCHYNWFISPSNFKRNQCPGCRPGIESKVREIFERLTGYKFPSIRPKWLKNPDSKSNGLLQLDGYCEELKLAFEYDGEFHYVPFWGTCTTSTLEATQKRDQIKDLLCKNKGIFLIRIPFFEKKNLENFIKNKLLENKTNDQI